jgi:methylglutaconyl-CoA hydratase
MTDDLLKISSDENHVTTLILTCPDKHNAFDDKLIVQLNLVLDNLREKPEIRALVLRSTGKSFSAGADLNWMKRMQGYSMDENIADAEQLRSLMENLNTFPKPTIAVVEGAAFGGGVGLIACCDMAIATSNAYFAFSEVKIGLAPAVISPYIIDCIGAKACRRYFLTGEKFNALRAKEIGLINEIAESTEINNIVSEFLKQILAGSPQSQQVSKQLLIDLQGSYNQEKTVQTIAKIRVSPEGQEGLNAFLEKRKPSWNNA